MTGILPIIIALIILLGGAAGFYGKIHHDGVVTGKAEVQPKLDACNTQVATMGGQIKEQNAAVDALKAAGEQKAKEAATALKAAEGKAKVWQDNAVRLQGVLTARKPDGPKDCKAAWEEIRKP